MVDMFLESWDRQARMMNSLAGLVGEQIQNQRPSEDGMSLIEQLAHVVLVRREWLHSAAPQYVSRLHPTIKWTGESWEITASLDEIREQLVLGAQAVRDAAAEGIEKGGKFGPYDHAVFFIQHMVWHEGYHAALILLALRNAGFDPTDEWMETHVWELWRGPDVWQG